MAIFNQLANFPIKGIAPIILIAISNKIEITDKTTDKNIACIKLNITNCDIVFFCKICKNKPNNTKNTKSKIRKRTNKSIQ